MNDRIKHYGLAVQERLKQEGAVAGRRGKYDDEIASNSVLWFRQSVALEQVVAELGSRKRSGSPFISMKELVAAWKKKL